MPDAYQEPRPGAPDLPRRPSRHCWGLPPSASTWGTCTPRATNSSGAPTRGPSPEPPPSSTGAGRIRSSEPSRIAGRARSPRRTRWRPRPSRLASEVSVAFPAAERVRVQASRTVPLFFSRLFLGPTKTITAYSVAGGLRGGLEREGAEAVGDPVPVGGHERERRVRCRGDGLQGLSHGGVRPGGPLPADRWDPGDRRGCAPGFAPGQDDEVAGRRIDAPVGDRLHRPPATFRAADVGFLRGDAGGPQDRDAAEQPEEPERDSLPPAGVRPLLRPRPRRERGLRLPGHDRRRQP